MRIAFAVWTLSGGGAEKQAAMYAEALSRMGHEVHIACLRDAPADYSAGKDVIVHGLAKCPREFRSFGTYRWLLRLTARLRSLRADVLIPFCMPVRLWTLCFMPAAALSRTKLIYAVRNNEPLRLPERELRLKRVIWRLADAVWLQTEDQRRFLSEAAAKKAFVLPNILDGRFLNVPYRSRREVRRFVSAGRICPQKNHSLLIRAFAEAARRTGNTDATLAIYGRTAVRDKPLEDSLRAEIRDLGMEDRIFLRGRAGDIVAEYDSADTFVLSSDYEGCPNALMEAMAAGLPCVSTDCPTGPSMLIDSGKNGILVPVGDADAMSGAMESLMSDPGLADRLGMAARRRMLEWAGADELAARLLERLGTICQRNGRAVRDQEQG